MGNPISEEKKHNQMNETIGARNSEKKEREKNRDHTKSYN
jgi:hypothetical protein